METWKEQVYDDCWKIVNRRGISDGVQKWYEVQLLYKEFIKLQKQADAKLKAEEERNDARTKMA